MSRASKARKIATAAAYGGGGLGALGAIGGAAVYGLIVGESKLARRRIREPEDDPPASDRTRWRAEGVDPSRPPLRLAVLGDSTGAGYGVHRERDTPAAQLAIGISAAAHRPVQVRCVARVGAQSSDLPAQLEQLGTGRPHIAAIIIGANDVTHRVRPSDAAAHLRAAVGELRARGAEVVVATCPDLGTIRPIAQPLRLLARRLSRRMAAVQTIAAVEAGARTVSLGDLLGALFAARRELFSDDQFHPSAAGYAAAVQAMLPSALDALGLATRARAVGPFATQRARPIEKVAVQAAAHPGSEVAAEPAAGRTRRGRGPVARLRRRRARQPVDISPNRATPMPDAQEG